MTLSKSLTDSINGEVAYSGGQQRTNYEQHFGRLPVKRAEHRSGGGTLIIDSISLNRGGLDNLSRLVKSDDRTHLAVLKSGSRTLSPLDFIGEIQKKRILTCLAALIMPEKGVDENLESALSILQFYREQAHYDDTPSLEAAPTQLTGVIGEVRERPPMVLADC